MYLLHFHLEPPIRRLLLISGLFSLSIGLSNTFVNIFIWKVDKNFTSIALYNLSIYLSMPIAFVLAGMICMQFRIVFAMRFGLILHILFYGSVLFAGEMLAPRPYILGGMMGLAAGFYWFSFNMFSLTYTASGQRDGFFGFNGVVMAVAGMIAPLVAGQLIATEDRFGGLTGYHVIFAISLGLFLAAVFCCHGLGSDKLVQSIRLQTVFSALQYRSWRMTVVASALYGIREGVFVFLISLLMYLSTGSEISLGNFLFMQGGLSFISFYFVGRYTTGYNRLRILQVGAGLMAAAALLFLLPISTHLILWYGGVIALVLPLFLTPMQAFVFDEISFMESKLPRRAEHLIVRELFSNGGRAIGIFTFLLLTIFTTNQSTIAKFAVGIGFVQLFSVMFLQMGNDAKLEANSGDSSV